ncbi:MAG: glycosyltransferase family 1 protein [Candidatus Daviesbacteria bacterium]|nr:glycosyltransferase family 1 protein [Candidatus Daviesbacteria bacterium]
MITIGFCNLPLKTGHKNRGIGIYTSNLLEHLKENPKIKVVEFEGKIPPDVDIIHYPWFDFYFRTLPFFKSKPTVVTIHDTIPLILKEGFPVGLKGKINFALQKLSLRGCKAIIVNSQDSKKNVIKYLGVDPNKITVTYLAQSNDFRVLSESQKLKIKNKFNLPEKFLLFVGDANYSKNLPFLINAFKKAVETFPDLKLVLVGEVFLKKLENIDHPELKSLKEMNQKIKNFNLEDKVIRPGWISNEDLIGFYNLATVYVQPSLYEGFGFPILQAFSCGCPVISSNAGALPEVVGDAGILFDPTNLNQLLSILTEVLDDKTVRQKLSKLGLERAKNFSWGKTAEETLKIYEKVIANR